MGIILDIPKKSGAPTALASNFIRMLHTTNIQQRNNAHHEYGKHCEKIIERDGQNRANQRIKQGLKHKPIICGLPMGSLLLLYVIVHQ